MADQMVSTHFQALFDSALQAYKRNTGITLAEHSLTAQLDRCSTVEDMTALLQRQAEAISDLQARHRIIKSIKTTVSILIPLHVAVGLVRQNALMACFTSLTVFMQTLLPSKAIQAGLAILLDVRVIPWIRCGASSSDI
jgi:hypothetical protein